jgi:hypothetical protein
MMYARASIEGSEFGVWTMRKALAWYADDEEQFLRGDGAPYASVPPRVSSTAKASRAALRRLGKDRRSALRARAVIAVKDRHELRTENRLLREALEGLLMVSTSQRTTIEEQADAITIARAALSGGE